MRTILASLATALLVGQAAPTTLPPWTPGTLDIHQIVTARGNAAFIRSPDGTSMLVDAGDQGTSDEMNGQPDRSRPAADTITAYLQHALGAERPHLDYALFTHFHPDHVGALSALLPRLQVDTIVDRGYDYLAPPRERRGVPHVSSADRWQGRGSFVAPCRGTRRGTRGDCSEKAG